MHRDVAEYTGAGLMRQALPTFAAVFDAVKKLRKNESTEDSAADLKTRINDADVRYMQAFASTHKTRIMRKIRRLEPLSTDVGDEDHHFEKTMIQLHEQGYGLIEMLPLETALTSAWLRRGRLRLGFAPADITMVVWETLAGSDATTVTTWRI